MEYNLPDPGFVENAPDGASCLLACIQMVMQTKIGNKVLSFTEMDKILRRKKGEYAWEYALLSYLANDGFETKSISTLDPKRLYSEKESYIYKYYGTEGAKDQITHSNMENVYADARAFAENTKVDLELRVPQKDDITGFLRDGYYLIPYINQRILQADPGIAAHVIFVYGYSNRGVRFHNPGPPSTRASEITWDLFMRAWSSPSENARQLIACKAL